MLDLKKVCASALNLKIIGFFHENPQTVDTSWGLATWLNHDRQEVKCALDYLVAQKILVTHRLGSSIAYAYTQEKEIVKKIEQFLKKRHHK